MSIKPLSSRNSAAYSHRQGNYLLRAQRHWQSGCLLAGALAILAGCGPTPAAYDPAVPPPPGVVPVRVQKTAQGYRLLRGEKPYFLRGGAGLQQFAQLKAAGGNTVRLWSTDYATPLMEEAHKQGLSVMLGLWLQPEGSHFSYYDPAKVQAQLALVRQQILRYRRHPALLCWNIANEMDVESGSPRFYEALNDIALLVHELDPYHPVTVSQTDEFEKYAATLHKRAPAVDILSINVYGGLGQLHAKLRQSGWQGPYIVTEYGGRGYWETYKTAWQAPLEQTSADKATFMRTRYEQTLAIDTTQCLGGYVFFWGSKIEYTPTWFSLFEPTGEKTEMVDELHWLWRHQYPANRAPHLTRLLLGGRPADGNLQARAGQRYPALVEVTDPESDSLATRWEVLPELPPGASGKALISRPEPVAGCIVQAQGRQALVQMPASPGNYRLYARVFDGHGSVGTANIPFKVLPEVHSARDSAAATSSR
jgi:hypothetical protein